MEGVPGQSGLHRETLSQNKQENKNPITTTNKKQTTNQQINKWHRDTSLGVVLQYMVTGISGFALLSGTSWTLTVDLHISLLASNFGDSQFADNSQA